MKMKPKIQTKKEMKLKSDYDKKYDIFSVYWGKNKVDYSEEITSHEGHEFVIDYDKKGRIVGIEIMNWNKGRPKKQRRKKK